MTENVHTRGALFWRAVAMYYSTFESWIEFDSEPASKREKIIPRAVEVLRNRFAAQWNFLFHNETGIFVKGSFGHVTEFPEFVSNSGSESIFGAQIFLSLQVAKPNSFRLKFRWTVFFLQSGWHNLTPEIVSVIKIVDFTHVFISGGPF